MLKIHDKLWFVSRGKDTLSYMTYYENNSAFNKRKETGLKWANSSVDGKIIENEKTTGFEIVSTVSRVTTQNKYFRIRDPRGFIVEVPSGNIPNILSCTTVINGVVQDECVWGKTGQDHVLIPVNSVTYQEATINYKKSTKKVKMSEVEVGEIVEVSSYGAFEKLIYLGKCKGIYSGAEISRSGSYWNLSSKKVADLGTYTEKKYWHVFGSADSEDIKNAVSGEGYVRTRSWRTPTVLSRSGNKVDMDIVEKLRDRVTLYPGSEVDDHFRESVHDNNRAQSKFEGSEWK